MMALNTHENSADCLPMGEPTAFLDQPPNGAPVCPNGSAYRTEELQRKVCKEAPNICKNALPLLTKWLSLIKPWLHLHSRVGLCVWHDLILKDLFKFDAILRDKL